MSEQEQAVEPQTGPLSDEQAAALISQLEDGGEYQPKDEGRSEDDVREATEAEKRAPPKRRREQTQNAEATEQENEDATPPEEAISSEDEEQVEDLEAAEDEIEAEKPESESEDELPILDPPRSWSKTNKDAFRTLPRESQEQILDLEDSREREVRNLQNETAEQRRATEAKQRQLDEARQRYESALPQVEEMLNSELSTKFPDVRSYDDLVRLSQSDPKRWAEYQTLSQRQQAVQQDRAHAEQQKQSELMDQFQTFAREQDAKFLEAAPEWGDSREAEKLQRQAVGILEDVGFSRDEIQAAWVGGVPLSARDHRFQLLLRDAVRYRQGQRAAVRAKAKPSVKVTKPGTASTKAEVNEAQLEARYTKLAKTNSADDAVALLLDRGF